MTENADNPCCAAPPHGNLNMSRNETELQIATDELKDCLDALDAAKADLKSKQQAVAELFERSQEVHDAMQAEEEVRRLEHAAKTGGHKLSRAIRKYSDGMNEAKETGSQ